jgi:hypothetical protein
MKRIHADPDQQNTSHKKDDQPHLQQRVAIVDAAPDMNKEVLVVGVLVPLLVHEGAVLEDAQPLGGDGAAQPGGGGGRGRGRYLRHGQAEGAALEWLHAAQETR